MGQAESYIAWDGRRYEGQPPDGWFLAADNRWWPASETTADSGQQPPSPTAEQAKPLVAAPPPPQSPSSSPPPAPSEAPPPQTARQETQGAKEPAADRWSRSRSTQASSQRRSAGWAFWTKRLLFLFVGMAVVGRCVAAVEPLPELEPESSELLVEAESGFRATTESCVGGVIRGDITNWSGGPRTFVIASTVPDGMERRSQFLSIDHLETVEWQIEAPVFGQGPCELKTVYVLE